jgi:hypothetical protein
MAEPRDPGRTRRRRRRGGVERAAELTTERAERGRQQSDYRPTQLPFRTAMRAREVATPTIEDLAAAAEDVVLVRRHYVPLKPID